MTESLKEAEAALIAARTRHADLITAAKAAEAKAISAEQETQNIIARVAAGGAATVSDMAAARVAAREARDAASFSAALADAAKAGVDRAEVAWHQATADALRAEQDELKSDASAAAAELDNAVERARAALERLSDIEARAADLRFRIGNARVQTEQTGRANSVLKATDRGEWPQFANPDNVGFRSVPNLSVAVVQRNPMDPNAPVSVLRSSVLASLGLAAPDPDQITRAQSVVAANKAASAEAERFRLASMEGARMREGLTTLDTTPQRGPRLVRAAAEV